MMGSFPEMKAWGKNARGSEEEIEEGILDDTTPAANT